MKDIGLYQKKGNDIDVYLFRYNSGEKIATADHMIKTPIEIDGGGTGRRVATLENIQNEQEAYEKLRETVDKF